MSSISTWRRVASTAVSSFGRLGFGRQGAIAVVRSLPTRAQTPALRLVSLIVGSSAIGLGVALLVQADLGLTPYDVLVSGLQPHLGLSFGQTVWLVAAAFFALAAAVGQYPSWWGVGYVVANGVAIDAAAGIVNPPGSLGGRWIFVVVALFALCAGISLVVHSGSTGGAFELLMRAGEVRGLDRRTVRTTLEVSVLAAGIVLGGAFGPATVFMALTIGPMLGVGTQVLLDHRRGRRLRRIEADPKRHHPSALTTR